MTNIGPGTFTLKMFRVQMLEDTCVKSIQRRRKRNLAICMLLVSTRLDFLLAITHFANDALFLYYRGFCLLKLKYRITCL